jgi:hypothetical protein
MVRRGALDRAGLDDAVFRVRKSSANLARPVGQSEAWFQVNI